MQAALQAMSTKDAIADIGTISPNFMLWTNVTAKKTTPAPSVVVAPVPSSGGGSHTAAIAIGVAVGCVVAAGKASLGKYFVLVF